MGIFSWIFSKNTESNSLVRKWVVQEIEKVDTANPDDYGIFVGLINAAIQYGKNGINEQDDQLSKVSRQYLGDATIFEVACYTYYRLEDWIAKNQPELTAELAYSISRWILEKFAVTFYVEEEQIGQLFEERLNQYKALAATGANLTKLHLELEQRILLTKGDKFNRKALKQDPSIVAMESQFIKRSLAAYEEMVIPALIESIQNYSIKTAEKQLKKKQNLEQYQEQKDYLYAMALLAQKDSIRACKAFTKVIDADPEHYDSLVQRGLLYAEMHQPADALQDFTVAIKVKPNESEAYLQRGKCYHQNLRRREEALSDYAAAIRLAPRDITGYFGRGELYHELALYDEQQALENDDHGNDAQITEEFLAAIDDYSQVIALKSEHDAAYAGRGLVYARMARVTKKAEFMEKAIEDIEKAISLNWENGYLFKQQDEMKELLEQVSQSGGQ